MVTNVMVLNSVYKYNIMWISILYYFKNTIEKKPIHHYKTKDFVFFPKFKNQLILYNDNVKVCITYTNR